MLDTPDVERTDDTIIVGDTTVVNKRTYIGDGVYCGRQQGGADITDGDPGEYWGNPWEIGDTVDGERLDRGAVVAQFDAWLTARLQQDGPAGEAWRDAVRDLQGDTLVCWCAPQPCHAEVLATWAERLATWH